MNNEETRKQLHELIDKLSNEQVLLIYQLIRGVFGEVI